MVGISKTCFLPLILLLSAFLFLVMINLGSCNGDFNVRCIEIERKALVELKAGLVDPSGRLSSWVGEDCCRWNGVKCSNKTGRVLKLKLGTFSSYSPSNDVLPLSGQINPSLLDLKHLIYLDLSNNYFEGAPIPKFMGSLKKLRYLDLSNAGFGGTIPSHLGNLSSLCYLDLNSLDSVSPVVNNLHWLPGLSSLKYLDMGSIDLSNAALDWLEAVNKLPSLLDLRLRSCKLVNLPPSMSFVNFTSLAVLDLSHNYFNSSIPSWLLNISTLSVLNLQGGSPANKGMPAIHLPNNQGLRGGIPRILGNLCNLQKLYLSVNCISGKIIEFIDGLSRCRKSQLQVLDLANNKFTGHLPDSLGQLKELKSVILSNNSFWGSIPASIGDLSSLRVLDLFDNNMNGTIPNMIGKLSQLDLLELAMNSWDCVITEAHFQNLTKLKTIDLSSLKGPMSLRFQVSKGWIPSFSLQYIRLVSTHLGPNFPAWLRTQNELRSIELMNVGISDTIPDWFWKSFPQISELRLPNKPIIGKLPANFSILMAGQNEISPDQVSISGFLRINQNEGPLPDWSTLNYLPLDLGNNSLSGSIPQNIGELMPHLKTLDLSGHRLNGTIPSSIVELKFLTSLILSNNRLFGEIPQNWNGMQSLSLVDFSNNNLSGQIPSSMRFLTSLQWLILSNNNFDGEFPSLQNCNQLATLDVSENKISGNLPTWIAGSLSNLEKLLLRSNFLVGNIPQQLCLLSKLHILDLADNNLSGVIPQCIWNLSGMVSSSSVMQYPGQQTRMVTKGSQRTYNGYPLYYGKVLDLSKNNLWGEIPMEITRLFGLNSLDLSMNHLSGKIPEKIGSMQRLESLDLSRNQLSGSIPQTMSSLTSLSFLNLSYNNLSGRIPSGNQLQTLNNASFYTGNPLLCGQPLATKCPGDHEKDQDPTSTGTPGGEGNKDDDGGTSEMLWFYASMAVGFVVGFWGVCGTLLMKSSWRHAYFQFFEDLKDRLVLIVALNVARLQRKITSQRN